MDTVEECELQNKPKYKRNGLSSWGITKRDIVSNWRINPNRATVRRQGRVRRTCDSVVAYGAFTGERTVVYHSPYGIQQGTKTIAVRAVDMDVVVILV